MNRYLCLLPHVYHLYREGYDWFHNLRVLTEAFSDGSSQKLLVPLDHDRLCSV